MSRIEIINGKYVYSSDTVRKIDKDFEDWLEKMSMMNMLGKMRRRILSHTDCSKPFVWHNEDGSMYNYEIDMQDDTDEDMSDEYDILQKLML